jgi:peptide chain release factor 2
MKKIKADKQWVDRYEAVEKQVDDLEVLLEFIASGDVTETELDDAFRLATEQVEDLEMFATLDGEEDKLSCMLKINAGAGGTESCDWAEMLHRMYVMWAERNGHAIKELNRVDGDVAGVKSVTLEIDGEYAYGMLKGENGVHRLVRPSPFNAQGKRQTSFVSVFVYPMVDDTIKIEINPSDIEFDTFRASGAGGQHVNRTESAIRIRHLPSGVVVECQEERSQHQNRDKAMQMLRSELYKIEVEKRNEAKRKVEDSKQKIEWGSQIRSYVLDDKRIKDHRSNHQTHDIKRVLDGDIDDFLKATLMAGVL